MGISLLTGFVNDIATDSGNKALANQIVFAGKIAIVALALPVFIQVMELIKQMIK
jgi:stage III sporulation protein AD